MTMKKTMAALSCAIALLTVHPSAANDFDVVVYGSSPAAISAAGDDFAVDYVRVYDIE